jgi:hypothetical protein
MESGVTDPRGIKGYENLIEVLGQELGQALYDTVEKLAEIQAEYQDLRTKLDTNSLALLKATKINVLLKAIKIKETLKKQPPDYGERYSRQLEKDMEEYKKDKDWKDSEESPCGKCSNGGMCMIATGCDDWKEWEECHTEPKPCAITLQRKGCPHVNDAFVLAAGPNIVAINVDMGTKRGKVGAWGSDDDIPLVSLEINDESIGYNTMARGPTEVSFPEYKGWSVWAADWIKYTVSVCLVKK